MSSLPQESRKFKSGEIIKSGIVAGLAIVFMFVVMFAPGEALAVAWTDMNTFGTNVRTGLQDWGVWIVLFACIAIGALALKNNPGLGIIMIAGAVLGGVLISAI